MLWTPVSAHRQKVITEVARRFPVDRHLNIATHTLTIRGFEQEECWPTVLWHEGLSRKGR